MSGGLNIEQLSGRIHTLFSDARVEWVGADCSFELLVVSEALRGLSPVARQRMLLKLFAPELASGVLHALSIRALTPDELSAHSPRLVQLGE